MAAIVPTKITLKMSTIVEIFSALQQFQTYTKITGGKQKDESVQVPYAFEPMVLVAIALNIQGLRGVVEANSKAIEALHKQHLSEPYDDNKADPVERAARNAAVKVFNEAATIMSDAEHKVKLRILKVSDLTKGGPISPNVIAVLSPLLDLEDAGDGDEDTDETGDEK